MINTKMSCLSCRFKTIEKINPCSKEKIIYVCHNCKNIYDFRHIKYRRDNDTKN